MHVYLVSCIDNRMVKEETMKLIYIAGPFAGKNNAEIQQNINATIDASRFIQNVWPDELCPVCPHTNFGGLELMGACTQDQIMNMCIALLGKCNAILMLPGWGVS